MKKIFILSMLLVPVMVFAVSSSPIYQLQERRHEPPKNWQMLRE